MTGYDIIGDVHGYADRLTNLLGILGYTEVDGVWTPSDDRKAVFVGDLIDRGEKQLETLRIVRAMERDGHAHVVMGNHEYNAIAYATVDSQTLDYCRPHSKKNKHQHEAFIGEVDFGSPLHRSIIGWFMKMPLWLDLGGIRVVHACWSEAHMEELEPLLTKEQGMWRLTPQAVVETSRRDSDPYDALEVLLKGPEIEMDGYHYYDKDGHRRKKARVAWWKAEAETLRDLAIVPGGSELRAPDGTEASELPANGLTGPVPRYDSEVPVFVGHYWRSGSRTLLADQVACVDYSAGKGGPLVAYRWDGETVLDRAKFVVG